MLGVYTTQDSECRTPPESQEQLEFWMGDGGGDVKTPDATRSLLTFPNNVYVPSQHGYAM